MVKRKLEEINWKKGSGEIVGFTMILPVITFIFCAMVAVAQVGLIRQKLEYTVYTAGRAAVVSDTKERANKRAKRIAKETLRGTGGGLRDDSIKTSIALLDSNKKWEKGKFVRVKVEAYVKAVMPFTSGKRTSTIVMMVERPATDERNVE